MRFTRRAASETTDWREDPKVVTVRARIAQLDTLIQQAAYRLASEHAARVATAEADLHRAELEVLAGRASDTHLAAKQAAHMDARVAEAKDALAIEDLTAERADLVDVKLPAVEKQARGVVHAAVQAKAITLLKELRGHLRAAVQCEAELTLLRREAESQFPGDINHAHVHGNQQVKDYYDPACLPAAGVPTLTHTIINRVGLYEALTVESRNAAVLDDIDAALSRLDPTAAAAAA